MIDKIANQIDVEIIDELQQKETAWLVVLGLLKERRYFTNYAAAGKCRDEHNKDCHPKYTARMYPIPKSDVPEDHILFDSW